MTRTTILRWLLGASLLAAYGAIAVYSDPFLLWIYKRAVFSPYTILGGVLYALYLLARRRLRTLIRFAVVCGVLIVPVLLIPINNWVLDRAMEAGKAYPPRVASVLKEYREQHGKFPDSLDQLPAHPRVPRLLRREHAYSSRGDGYSFYLHRSMGDPRWWYFHSEAQKWAIGYD